MLAAGIGAFALVRSSGQSLVAPDPIPGAPHFGTPTSSAAQHPLLHVLLALVAIILVARVFGEIFRRINQPPVIGEMVAGLVLGPSVLGRFAPEVSAAILPPQIAPLLGIVAQVGVVLFMFLVGLELDTSLLKKRPHASVAISHASITAPFVLGGLLALFVYPRQATSDVPFFVFALFMGVSMSVTAFPVLARILTDRKMHRNRLGVIALTCAAVDDVTAWCLLALVVGVAKASLYDAAWTAGLTFVFVAVTLLVVRPLVLKAVAKIDSEEKVTQGTLAWVVMGLLLSAMTTEAIGIHALFGAFIFGALIPHDSPVARAVSARLGDLVVVLFLPAFFAFTGMRTQIGLVSGAEAWLLCGLITLVATLGKFGGSFLAGKLTGLSTRESAAVGVLMNTRGLMELVVLNLGLDLRVISPTLFAMLVIMALVTTFATSPLLHLIYRGRHAEALARESVPDLP